ncbi:MAG TPA: type II toxin-antitoxin system prevent-host-death family antitoxin [Candidatus Kapabacteria bacterium]|nr:type II toxin-antitoxin system prevent-host-death family antitoxin [Candidatus Kapabacteria bacterium]
MQLTAVEFKSKCLELMDQVEENHEEVIITRDGKPVAKLIPVEEEIEHPLFGFMKGTVKIKGDIITPLDEKWEVEN